MKTFFKTTTLIAAIGMIVYTVYVLTRYIVYQVCSMHPYHFNLWDDILERLIFDILPVSLIIVCCGLWQQRPSNAASKSFRVLTVCLFVALIGTLVFSPLYTHQIVGMPYLFPSIYWRAILLIFGIVWLFMLMRQPLGKASPRSYQVTLILAMAMFALPIVLEMISGISLLCGREIVLGLHSSAIKSWVKYIAPILPLVFFVFPRIEKINYMRNSHCTPGSYAERTFNRNRAITLFVIGIAIVSIVVAFISYSMSGLLYLNLRLSHLLHAIGSYAVCMAGVTIIISWIMLSVMAFRQLPNPRGYKIYNIVCQFLVVGNLIAAVIATMYEDSCSASSTLDNLALVFFLVVGAFIPTTTIRVISYSIPASPSKSSTTSASL